MSEKRNNTRRWTSRWLLILSVTAAGVLGTTATAQSPVVVLGQPYQLAFDHDGLNTTHYRILLTAPGSTSEQAIGADVPVTSLSNGVVTVDMPALTVRGAYRLRVAARHVDPQGLATPGQTYSAFLDFTAEPPSMTPPAAPSNLRIIRVTVAVEVVR